jgi:hypothetical protein
MKNQNTTVSRLLAVAILLMSGVMAAATNSALATELGAPQEEKTRNTDDQRSIRNQMSKYQKAYPGIDFRLLSSHEDYKALMPLEKALGAGVANVDYEHPDTLRTTLVEAQEYRIGLMIENEMSSATLFHTPQETISGKQYTCLITIDSSLLRNASWLIASQYLYDLDRRTIESMPERLRFSHQDVLLYTLNHEVFHCIDVYLNGFLFAQTDDPFKASYDRRRAEIRADIFAVISHLSRQPSDSRFLANLALARTIQLLNGDTEHYSSDAINLIESDYQADKDPDIEFLVNSAFMFYKASSITYEEHRELLAAMQVVNHRFGMENEETGDDAHLADDKPDLERVDALAKKIRIAINSVNGNL